MAKRKRIVNKVMTRKRKRELLESNLDIDMDDALPIEIDDIIPLSCDNFNQEEDNEPTIPNVDW